MAKKRKKFSVIIAGDDGRLYKVGEDVIAQHEMSPEDPHFDTADELVDRGVTHAMLESHDEIDDGGTNMIAVATAVHLLNLRAFSRRRDEE